MGEADLGSDSGIQLRHLTLNGQGSVSVQLSCHSGLQWRKRGRSVIEWVGEWSRKKEEDQSIVKHISN